LELFHLAEDPAELRDLSARHAERVRELRGSFQAWAERVGARERLMATRSTSGDAWANEICPPADRLANLAGSVLSHAQARRKKNVVYGCIRDWRC
jgi:hypothetical protein